MCAVWCLPRPDGWTDYVAKYATKQAADDAGSDEEEEEDEEMSDLGDFSDDDQVSSDSWSACKSLP